MGDIIGKYCIYRDNVWKIHRIKPVKKEYLGTSVEYDSEIARKYYLKRIRADGKKITACIRREQFEIIEGDEKTIEVLYGEK